MKKKRTKKHCKLKRAETACKFALKDAVVRHIAGVTDGCELLDAKSGRHIRVSGQIEAAIKNIRHRWQYLVCVYEKESNGKRKTKIGYVPSSGFPLYQSELVDALNGAHKEMMTERTIGASWLAFPCFPDVSEEDEDEFIEHYGKLLECDDVWDFDIKEELTK